VADEEKKTRVKLPWGRVLVNAASRPTSLLVAGASAVGAAAIQSVPILAAGAVAYAALIAWDMLNPETWRRAIRGERASAQLPNPDSMLDPDARRAARDLLAAKRELEAVLKKNPDQVNHFLGLALGTLAEMEDRAARLLTRLDDISRFLAGANTQAIQAEIRSLEGQAQRTADRDAKNEFENARAAREQQLTTVKQLVDARDRLLANLARLVATYQGLPGRVVHMRALDAQAVDAMSGDVNKELDRMNHEMAAFEETLKVTPPEVRA